jgi:hypothetical protein
MKKQFQITLNLYLKLGEKRIKKTIAFQFLLSHNDKHAKYIIVMIILIINREVCLM